MLITLSPALHADDILFKYPQVPENLPTLSQRANYLVEHFWDQCNLKSAFSARDKLASAFHDYVTYMQFASIDTVNMSINKLIKEVQKTPKNMLTLAQIAEETLYGDSAQFWSDELYLPFATAVTKTKKLSKAEKARYVHQVTILTNSMVGATAPSFNFVSPTGEMMVFDSISAPAIILFFNDPDCTDCRLAKARLSTDLNLNKLIDHGVIKIVSIHPGEADEQWKAEAANYPQNWIVGACEDIPDLFDMRTTPMIYQLDDKHKIIAKHLNVSGIIGALSNLNINF